MDDRTAAMIYGHLVSIFELPLSDGAHIYVERRKQREGGASWAIVRGQACFTREGIWECEPMPSSRTDEFLARARYDSLEYAMGVGVTLQAKLEEEYRLTMERYRKKALAEV